MNYQIVLAITLLTGCGQTMPFKSASTEPVPTDQFTSTANYSSIAGSQEIALDQAKEFCRHWGAAPGVIQSDTIDTKEEKNVGDTAKEAAKNAISTGSIFKADQRYKTTLIYKCFR